MSQNIFYVTRVVGSGTKEMYFSTTEGPFKTKRLAADTLVKLRALQPQFEFVIEEENCEGASRILRAEEEQF